MSKPYLSHKNMNDSSAVRMMWTLYLVHPEVDEAAHYHLYELEGGDDHGQATGDAVSKKRSVRHERNSVESRFNFFHYSIEEIRKYSFVKK